MIQPIEMYTVICDRCGKDCFEGEEMRAWQPKECVREVVENYCWVVITDKDYCSDCYELDEETDEYVVKPQELEAGN